MDVTIIFRQKRGQALPKKAVAWNGDFIFSYRNYWRLPETLLKNARIMAVNFHPATPEFPGSGCYNWALYKNSATSGITVHLMNCKIDSGKIIDVYTFPIDEGETVESLIKKTSQFSVTVFQDFVKKLSKKNVQQMQKVLVKNSKFKWARAPMTVKDINNMSKLDLEMTHEEFLRRIRAFHIDKFPVYIEHNGFRFNYVDNVKAL